jgi:hypothetical protein
VQDCLFPHCRELECEADVKLYGRVNRGRRWTVLNLDGLLRGDSATQTANLTSQVTTALRTINEARDMLGLNPLPEGDTLLVQGAMVPVERVLEEPEPPAPPPAPPGQEPAEEDGDEDATPLEDGPPEAMLRPFVALLAQTYDRLLRVEVDKARRAANRRQLREHAHDYYNGTSDERVAAALRPAFDAFLTAAGREADKGGPLALRAARRHNEASVAALAGENVAALKTCGGPAAERRARAELLRAWEATR